MYLTAHFYVGHRTGDGAWEIEASLDGISRDDRNSNLIFTGLCWDWIEMLSATDPQFHSRLLAGQHIASIDKHPWDGGNEWYITPLREGVVIEHQWSEEFQRGDVGWYTWGLVRAVVELSVWRNRMRENPSGLSAETLRSARMTVNVNSWQPPQSLASLGWKSCMD